MPAKLKTIENVKLENDSSELKDRVLAFKKLESSIVSLTHLYDKESLHLNQQLKSLKILDEVPCGDEYPACKFIKDAHLNKSKINEQENIVSISKKNLDDAVKVDVVRDVPRKLPDGPIACLNDSFGFGGHNVVLVFKSYQA